VISCRVVNASPLIFLTKVGLLQVLHEPSVPALVPDVVLAEVGRLDPDDPTVRAVHQSHWIRVVPTPAVPHVVLVWDLDAGESAVLAVALDQPGSIAILDDMPARRCARVLNVATQGTLGLVLVAKHLGMIPEVRPLLGELREAGMHMSVQLESQILEAAGESI
jgi:predicted nucleic acid-binding protein